MKKLLESLLEQDIFKPPTEEELEQARKEFEKDRIERFVKKYNGKQNPDGSYDFDRNIDRIGLGDIIVDGKFIIKFGKVKGYFDCYKYELTTLKGAPKYVGRDFDCAFNNLTSLKGAPEKVGGYFNCSDNKLTSLEGAPKYVGGSFYCSYNNLTSLEGAPEKVVVGFYCSHNKLTSLEGAPKYVGGNFVCFDNPVKFTEEDVRKVSEVKGVIEV